MGHLLAAYTPAGSYPPYFNLSYDEGTEEVVVTVRSPSNVDGSCGETAAIRIPVGEFWCLWREGMRELGPHIRTVPLDGTGLGFDEDHSVGPSREGGSVKRSHGAEGKNWID